MLMTSKQIRRNTAGREKSLAASRKSHGEDFASQKAKFLAEHPGAIDEIIARKDHAGQYWVAIWRGTRSHSNQPLASFAKWCYPQGGKLKRDGDRYLVFGKAV